MADGGLKLEIEETLAESVRAAAAKQGIPVEMFVRDALAHHIFADVEWSEDLDPSIDGQIADEALRSGQTISWEEIEPWLRSWGKPDELPPPKWPK